MTRKSIVAVAVGAALCAPGTPRAQSLDYEAFEELFGEPVTMSVTGSPQRASEVPASMEIISADEIRRSGVRDIPGILRHVAGIDVLQTTNDHADVSARGYNQPFSPRLLVLVDGRQVYADYYGFTPWSTIPIELETIRQIEVVKGPNSALFGFNAVGGVINIVTYHPLQVPVDAASLIVGTQDRAQGAAVSTVRFGDDAALRISAGHGSGDDFSTPQAPWDVGTRRGDERNTVSLNAGVRIADGMLLDLEGTYSEVDHAEFAPTLTMSHASLVVSSIKGSISADTSIGLVEATVYRNDVASDVSVALDTETFIAFDNDVTIAQLRTISKIGAKHTLRLSAEHRDNSMGTTPVTGADVFYDVASIGGMWDWQISPSLTLTTAVRGDRLALGREGMLPPGYGLTNEDWDRTLTETSYNLGAVWQASEHDTLRVLAGRGVQLPNLNNLGGFLLPLAPFGYASGVPTLLPSVVDNFEIGWDRALPGLGARLGVSVFTGRTRDVTALTGGSNFAAGLLGTPANVADSETIGVEVSIEGELAERWRWGASFTPQSIDDEFAPGLGPENTLLDFENTLPNRVVNARLGWTRGPWEVDGYLRYQSDFDGLEGVVPAGSGATRVAIPSYVSVDGRVGFELNDRMTLALSGQNLMDSEQKQSAAAAVERRLLGTFTVRF